MQWQREKVDSGAHGSLRPGAKQSAAADCIGLEHHPPAVFPCFPPSFLLSLYFLARPFSTAALLPLPCYSLFLPTLSNRRSDVSPPPSNLPPPLSLSLSHSTEARKKKSSPRISFCLPHRVRRRKRGEEGVEGRAWLFPSFPPSPPVNPSSPFVSFRRNDLPILLQTCFLSVLLIITRYIPPTPYTLALSCRRSPRRWTLYCCCSRCNDVTRFQLLPSLSSPPSRIRDIYVCACIHASQETFCPARYRGGLSTNPLYAAFSRTRWINEGSLCERRSLSTRKRK